jgi:hypothetical protein
MPFNSFVFDALIEELKPLRSHHTVESLRNHYAIDAKRTDARRSSRLQTALFNEREAAIVKFFEATHTYLAYCKSKGYMSAEERYDDKKCWDLWGKAFNDAAQDAYRACYNFVLGCRHWTYRESAEGNLAFVYGRAICGSTYTKRHRFNIMCDFEKKMKA